MTAVDFLISDTERACKALLDRARKVPADKLDWKPLDEGRSVLDMTQECTHSLLWPVELIEKRKFEMTPEAMEEYQKTRAEWKTLDDCEKAMAERFEKFKTCAKGLSDSQLSETIQVPWGPMTVLDALAIASWNFHYHTGQINYIQTLYGDKEM